MPERNKKEQDIIPMTPEAWRDQKLIALELRRRREKLRMTREELAEKMGEPYNAELIAQYENGGEVPMEMWTVFAIVEALDADRRKPCWRSGAPRAATPI